MRAALWLSLGLALVATDAHALRGDEGVMGGSEPMLEHADKVASYTLNAKLDAAAHTIHGTGTITWKNASKVAVSELWFHLYLNAFKNQSSVFMRQPIGGFRGNTLPTDWGAIDVRKLSLVSGADKTALAVVTRVEKDDPDETQAKVSLPSAAPPGSTITLEVEWDDKLPAVVERTGYFGSFHMVGQWFPKLARLEEDGRWAHFPFHHLGEFYSDFGTYDVTVDVPSGFIIGATGPITESKDENGRHIERHVQDDVHDFAFTAWDQWQVRKEKIDDVDVTVLTPPHYDDHAERELETMRVALPHYGKRYGKYPYSVLTLVHPPNGAPEAGGMEYPTLITTGQPSWLPRGFQFVEGVTIHEFGHQYFYGLLASNEDAWPFLDEGLNSYAENDGMVAMKGDGAGLDFLGLKVGDVEAQADRARHFGHDERVAQGAGDFGTGTAYGALVYSRTATILETLSRAYGPEKFQQAMGVYARRYRFKHPTPDDFIKVIAEQISPLAATNLRNALFERGWVDYAVTAISSHPSHKAAGMFDRDGTRQTVKPNDTTLTGEYDGWVLVVRRGTLHLPVHIVLVTDQGTQDVVWDGDGDTKRIPYSGSTWLRSVVVDPNHDILLDGRPENNYTTAPDAPSAGAPRVQERAIWWAETLLGGIGP
jgi:hypothetical protein